MFSRLSITVAHRTSSNSCFSSRLSASCTPLLKRSLLFSSLSSSSSFSTSILSSKSPFSSTTTRCVGASPHSNSTKKAHPHRSQHPIFGPSNIHQLPSILFPHQNKVPSNTAPFSSVPGDRSKRDDEDNDEKNDNKGKISHLRERILGALGTGYVALKFAKVKYIFAALKLTKFASLGSMVLSSLAYSYVFGWPYAIGMMGQILIHESGHALVMMHQGIPFKPMVFIPFMGAAVAMKDQPRDAFQEALIAFGGPVVGGATAMCIGLAGVTLDSQLLIALADFGLMINLFNLIPVGSMDGGRILGALSKWYLAAGLGVLGYCAFTGILSSPITYLILLAGGWSTYQRFRGTEFTHPPNYFKITQGQRMAIGAGYLGLVVALLVAMQMLKRYKLSAREQLAQQNPDSAGAKALDYYTDLTADALDDDDPEAKYRLHTDDELLIDSSVRYGDEYHHNDRGDHQDPPRRHPY